MNGILFEKEHKAIGSFPYIELINPNFNFISHYHEELEVIYIENGSITALSGATEIALNQGDICFFMPGEIHGFKSATANNIYVLKLNTNTYAEQLDFRKIRLKNNKITAKDEIYGIFKNILDQMRDEYIKKEIGYEFAIRHCKNQIIVTILRNMDYNILDNSKNLRLLNSVNTYLEENFDSQTDLETTARACHFSKYYFAHKLKELTGMTFTQYLNAFRLEKAVGLLRNTNMSITDIAFNCGYATLRSFNRAFGSAYNTTPSKYRKT